MAVKIKCVIARLAHYDPDTGYMDINRGLGEQEIHVPDNVVMNEPDIFVLLDESEGAFIRFMSESEVRDRDLETVEMTRVRNDGFKVASLDSGPDQFILHLEGHDETVVITKEEADDKGLPSLQSRLWLGKYAVLNLAGAVVELLSEAGHQRRCGGADRPAVAEDDYEAEGGQVNHPPHYNSHPSGVECIDIIEHMPFNIGSAVKYLWREGLKGQEASEKDLHKAIWYIQREIELRKTEGKA